MTHDRATVRNQVERIDGVTKAWFEWVYEEGETIRELVAEVNFDTDPDSLHFRQGVIDAVVKAAAGAVEDEMLEVVRVRIVPPP